MKLDGVRGAAQARCGRRLLNWYEDLRKGWK